MEKKSLITKKGKDVKTEIGKEKKTGGRSYSRPSEVFVSNRGLEMIADLRKHFDDFHTLPEQFDKPLEMALLNMELRNLTNPKRINFERGLVTFSPSSASKCERELFYKALKMEKDEQLMFPYQKRWVRNGSAIHGAVQKDLLYAEKVLPNPTFTVDRMPDKTPAWEHNLKDVKQVDHNGIRFQIFGMMDGILVYKDGTKVGFEFKTKSTTLGAIGEYKMKDAQDGHKEQCVAYSILFGVDEFMLTYESLAKDGWNKGEEAKNDMRPFYFKVTDADRNAMLDKFARVAEMVKDAEIPSPDFEKCIFCPFKSRCHKDMMSAHE